VIKLYFDTNIYNFISERHETGVVRKTLKSFGYKALASSTNLMEILANPDWDKRYAALETLTSVASLFEKVPLSFLEAQEVQFEIRRCRPDWIKPITYTKNVQKYLQEHQQNWRDARDGIRIFIRNKDIVQDPASKESLHLQKLRRQDLINGRSEILITESKNQKLEVVDKIDITDPEMYWRHMCLRVWYTALVDKVRGMKDYSDWLSPYIKDNCFRDPSYIDFWMKDVMAENVPYNRIVGLFMYYQSLHHKITHGNPGDQNHVGQLLDVDYFVTADRAFYDDMVTTTTLHCPNVGHPLLLNRSAPSACEEILSSLRQ